MYTRNTVGSNMAGKLPLIFRVDVLDAEQLQVTSLRSLCLMSFTRKLVETTWNKRRRMLGSIDCVLRI